MARPSGQWEGELPVQFSFPKTARTSQRREPATRERKNAIAYRVVLPSRENWNTYCKRAALGGRTPDWADLVRGKIAERGCTTTVSATAALSMQGRNRWIRFEELFFGTKAFARNMPRALDVVRLSKFRVPWVQTKRDKHPRLISYRPGWRSLVLVALKKFTPSVRICFLITFVSK